MEWISVSGIAALSRDRDTIHALYAPDWKMFKASYLQSGSDEERAGMDWVPESSRKPRDPSS